MPKLPKLCRNYNKSIAYQTTVRLPHLSSQFFSNIDAVLNQFLTPLVLSWQKFQISQSFTYEGHLVSSLNENLVDAETANDNFIEDIIDEPQITLASLLNGIETSNIIEMWRIRRIGGLSRKDNLVILLDDGTHFCTCLETITKGIICRHFWRVMLYSHLAKFHISIISIRWYKDNILSNLDINLKNSSILTAIETSTDITSFQITCTFQSLHHIQGSDRNEVVYQNTHQRNKFGIAFSTAKTAINVALKTNSDHELITLLKDFIESKREKNIGDDDDIKENHDIIGINESSQEDGSIIPLQKDLIEQITDLRVTKIRGAPSKKRLKSAIEVSKKRIPMQEISDESNTQPVKQQRRCLSCGKFGHYQKRCPLRNAK
ncbi:hypothetical protein RirG_130120 [Rhizophagus irregularis DAOM 197198w]|uniref:CCHC-type domain-containing protein n=1 Tax=Rhizophagus irregularis (strain DAOM 197198w) TaxID=1432141 RepID=A0A015JFA7_RHIIW|nr:hypothetical protein RirG_130120 [Rhizophagus irregularis DAOM 197198w]